MVFRVLYYSGLLYVCAVAGYDLWLYLPLINQHSIPWWFILEPLSYFGVVTFGVRLDLEMEK